MALACDAHLAEVRFQRFDSTFNTAESFELLIEPMKARVFLSEGQIFILLTTTKKEKLVYVAPRNT